ncbi:LysR family transcriptional regulator [Alteromonas sp. IB21]|uniref:LysR family transcriptional regulator n=1 Tax=Alteromonas sp. IB21 TaxID=2779369 RepID=UPI0018E73E38|nr:LysR family transcriptional regulator [Alteromonas sp. IB21]MBJ2128428.1 LysR family transcriptional regulator [Alteromonas sp. IB21]|tara:strand:+ start:170 stop:1054 length:885 start_codon:yes stop_codon:yes gene_type:complete
MDVSYRQIKAFVEVAKSSTFAEAAVSLHLTQPALSSAIKKMEEQLGGKLFQRNTRNVSLTPEGEVLFPNAVRLLHDWDNTFSDIQNLFAMAKGHLTICAMPSFAEAHLPEILFQFHQRAPNVNLRIVDVVMEQVIHEVTTGRSEIGFSFEPERKDGLIFESLFDDQFVVVANEMQASLLPEKVKWLDCLALPLVMMNRGSAVRHWTQTQLAMHGELNIVAETGQLSTIGKLIQNGLGISIMPSICERQMEGLGLVLKEVSDEPLIKNIGLIKNARKSLSIPAQSLWNLAIAHYA